MELYYMKYATFLREIFEEHTSNKRVLEFGGSCGIHGEIVREYADTLFTVDPHIRYDIGGDITPDFYGTANDYYKQVANPEADVVLCMGLLYHLHSPFHLLEQIVNLSKPKVLIVESLKKLDVGAAYEIDWAHTGNAHADSGVEYPLQINCGPKGEHVVKALETTPYKLDKFYEYGIKWEDSVVDHEFWKHPAFEMVAITDWHVPTTQGGKNMLEKAGMWTAVFTR